MLHALIRTTAHLALLGFGVTSDVARGENAGRKLTHDFVALVHHESRLEGSPLRAEFKLDEKSGESQRRALVAWVNVGGDPTPIQATGGWLMQSHQIQLEPRVSRSEAALSKRLVRMVPGSAWELDCS
jgi:hypothetical protein